MNSPPKSPMPSTAPSPSGGFSADRAADVCERFDLSEQAARLLVGDMTPLRLLDALTERRLHSDSVRLLAHGLAKRDAVHWACLCLREALGAGSAPRLEVALKAAERWVQVANDESRLAAGAAAETAGYGTPAGLVALAACCSDGVPPKDQLTGEMVAGAVLLTAASAAQDDVVQRHQRFLSLGRVIADRAAVGPVLADVRRRG